MSVMHLKKRTVPQFYHLAFAWTLLVLLSAGSYLYARYSQLLDGAAAETRTVTRMDWIYRQWNSSHGGLYAAVTPQNQPNPHLAHVPERDITTPSGKKLTLVDPAYMIRQVHESGFLENRMMGHFTSLTPLRPENAPDEWEANALREMEKGRKEVAGIGKIDGERFIRVITPLETQESCLKCHGAHGYRVGDIRGGLSAALPWSRFMDRFWRNFVIFAPGMLLIWLVGLFGLRTALNRISQEERDLFRAARLASLGTLTSGIAHEINNPLVSASGNLSILAEKRSVGSSEAEDRDFRKHVGKIQNAHARIADVVSGIRVIAEADAQNFGAVDLHDIIREIRQLSDALLQIPPERIGVSFGARSAIIHGHAGDIRKILLHLLSNARDAVGKLEGKGLIQIRTEERASGVCLRISDVGVGIPSKDLERIFDPFFTSKEPGRGLGLGLFISRNLAEQMSAEMDVQSEEGKGTQVTVLFKPAKPGA